MKLSILIRLDINLNRKAQIKTLIPSNPNKTNLDILSVNPLNKTNPSLNSLSKEFSKTRMNLLHLTNSSNMPLLRSKRLTNLKQTQTMLMKQRTLITTNKNKNPKNTKSSLVPT